MGVQFVVENAGCASCGERVRAALAAFGVVREIEIDEADDSARVRADFSPTGSRDAVDGALVEASAGSAHDGELEPFRNAAAVLLYVGRFLAVKRVPLLIRAYRRAQERFMRRAPL